MRGCLRGVAEWKSVPPRRSRSAAIIDAEKENPAAEGVIGGGAEVDDSNGDTVLLSVTDEVFPNLSGTFGNRHVLCKTWQRTVS